MARTTRAPLADQAAEALLRRIRDGEWPVGARLPGETTLAPQLGVGRSTVREAIRRLAGQGVLQTRQGAGVFVTALDVVEGWETVVARAEIAAVIEARIAVEVEAAGLAAVRRTPAALRAIRSALTDRAGAVGDDETFVDADMAFHRAVVLAADNPVLAELFDAFVPRVRQAMLDMVRIQPHAAGPSDDEGHAGLVEAVAERDAEAARRISRRHLESLRQEISAAPG